jgi:hypothetical protein
MSATEGTRLKERGMALAAMHQGSTLAAARDYLSELARMRGTVTADDAADFIEREGLPPLGNAAGSLFKGSEWEPAGDRVLPRRSTNQAHHNRVWRLRAPTSTTTATTMEASVKEVFTQIQPRAGESYRVSLLTSSGVASPAQQTCFWLPPNANCEI